MAVQVIMKDGRPEWAVIPYAEYEALLALRDGSATAAPVTTPAAAANKPLEQLLGGHTGKAYSGKFSSAKFAALTQSRGLTNASLAKDAGISPAYCEQIARGEREPSAAIIRGLAQGLKVKADDLLD